MSKQERYAGASALQGLSLGQQSAYISQYTRVCCNLCHAA